jgi:hypothetical protein
VPGTETAVQAECKQPRPLNFQLGPMATMTVFEAITLAIAGIGAVLGLVNTWVNGDAHVYVRCM